MTDRFIKMMGSGSKQEVPTTEYHLPVHSQPPDPNSPLLIIQAMLHTALFRIWPNLLFLGAWATMLVLVNRKTTVNLVVPPTLLTVLGTILGLVLSYRTSTAYERYWEGRRLWSQMVTNARCFSRTVWVHVPDRQHESTPSTTLLTPEVEARVKLEECEHKMKVAAEKRTMMGLTLAFAVAVKHYLRGEDGIYYEDLYPLVRFLPGYNMPRGVIQPDLAYEHSGSSGEGSPRSGQDIEKRLRDTSRFRLPLNAPSSSSNTPAIPILKPARNPPHSHMSDMLPFRFLPCSKRKRRSRKGDQRTRAEFERRRRKLSQVSQGHHSIPLEITMYMSTYIAALQRRKCLDVPTTNALFAYLNSFTDVLTSLERILTTPLPFSYAAHIWVVTYIYCLLLPFQIYESFGYITIPATVCTTFILVGLISLGQEIENPFGYDKNDLNLDYFCEHIIKPELEAIMSRPAAPPEEWVFDDANEMTRHGSLGLATRPPSPAGSAQEHGNSAA